MPYGTLLRQQAVQGAPCGQHVIDGLPECCPVLLDVQGTALGAAELGLCNHAHGAGNLLSAPDRGDTCLDVFQ